MSVAGSLERIAAFEDLDQAKYDEALGPLQQLGHAKTCAAVKAAVARRYLAKEEPLEALKVQAEASASTRAEELAAKAKLPPALQALRRLVAASREKGDKAAEARSLHLSAVANLAGGTARDAAKAAKDALALSRDIQDKKLQAAVLETVVGASFAKRDGDDALKAAKDLLGLAGDKQAQAAALDYAASAHLFNDEPSLAQTAAEDAVAAAKGADAAAQAAALSTLCRVHTAAGKPVSALKASKEAAEAAKGAGDKPGQAAALLLVAGAHAGGKESLEAAKEAISLFQGLQDKLGEAFALISAAVAHLSQAQPQLDDGLRSAREAAGILKEQGDKGGEAVALSAAAHAYILKKDGQEAERAAKEALERFQEAANAAGETYAQALIQDAQAAGSEAPAARVLFDDSGVAHVELSELASHQSLEAAIDTLLGQGNRGRTTRCVVLHLEGSPTPSGLQGYAVSVGSFLMGLRTVGLPVICACWGKIAGPSWGLLLASDYRIAATGTSFTLPIWGPPETLGDLVGHNVATQLCMTSGPANALQMLERGLVHQLQKGQDDTRRAASEMAKRIADHPGVHTRHTLSLLSPAMEKYALASARGLVRY